MRSRAVHDDDRRASPDVDAVLVPSRARRRVPRVARRAHSVDDAKDEDDARAARMTFAQTPASRRVALSRRVAFSRRRRSSFFRISDDERVANDEVVVTARRETRDARREANHGFGARRVRLSRDVDDASARGVDDETASNVSPRARALETVDHVGGDARVDGDDGDEQDETGLGRGRRAE